VSGAGWSSTEVKFNVFQGSLHTSGPFSAVAVHCVLLTVITRNVQNVLKWNIVQIYKKYLLKVNLFHCAYLYVIPEVFFPRFV
jgi:hypothetical protein